MEAAHKKAKRFVHVPEMSSLGKILEPKTLQRGHTHPETERGKDQSREAEGEGWGS